MPVVLSDRASMRTGLRVMQDGSAAYGTKLTSQGQVKQARVLCGARLYLQGVFDHWPSAGHDSMLTSDWRSGTGGQASHPGMSR
jgi:hypothetical protein